MRAVGEEIERLGSELTLIGNGSVEQAIEFQRDHSLPFRLLSDPSLDSYHAVELRRSMFSAYRPPRLRSLFRVWRSGIKGGAVQGDGLQHGGTFVITPNSEVVFSHIGRRIDDRADPEEILDALRLALKTA